MITYREAEKSEIPYIASLASSSFGRYPFFDFAFLDSFKTDDEYLAYMKKLHRIHLKANISCHRVIVGTMDGRIVSVALLEAPEEREAGIWDYIKAGGVSLVYPVGLGRILDFFNISEEAAKDATGEYPDGWYLEMLVVEGSMKGKGLGGKMINDVVVPYVSLHGGKNLTLITNTENNCRFYEKNGFTIFSERMIEMKGKKVRNWSLVRSIS